MKAWLCLNPSRFTITTFMGEKVEVATPTPAIGLLSVYRTKKDARSIHGPKAELLQVEWPDDDAPLDTGE